MILSPDRQRCTVKLKPLVGAAVHDTATFWNVTVFRILVCSGPC